MHTYNSRFGVGENIWIKPLKTEGRIGQVFFVQGQHSPSYGVRHAELTRLIETRLFEDELQNLVEHTDERKANAKNER